MLEFTTFSSTFNFTDNTSKLLESATSRAVNENLLLDRAIFLVARLDFCKDYTKMRPTTIRGQKETVAINHKPVLDMVLGCIAICDDVRVEGGVVIPVAAMSADAIFAGGMDI